MSRKTPWKLIDDGEKATHLSKLISEEARSNDQLVINAICRNNDQGQIFLYECNHILVDPDHHSELLANYEFAHEVLVVLPLVEGFSFFRDLNLPHGFEKEILPNPLFHLSAKESNVNLLSYKQNKIRHSAKDWTRHYVGSIEICFPVFWMTLVYGASVLYPKKDICTLQIGNREGILSLARVRSPESLQFLNYSKRKN